MNMSPRQIVAELDRYIIGQSDAKKAVAVALRNRYRRSMLSDELKDEITPKNIIMKGPTGVGKTEIARRLAKLVKAPFIKVEATKYTEVGYVGRDVESMVRDLAEVAVRLVKEEKYLEVETKAKAEAEKRISEVLFQLNKKSNPEQAETLTKAQVIEDLRSGKENNRIIEIEVTEESRPMEIMPGGGELNIGDMFGGLFPKRQKKRKLSVKEAMQLIVLEESEKMIDKDSINSEAVRLAENQGIIFIDEIDKIASRSGGGGSGPDVSREGVQRDILPIVEGCTVMTKYGAVRTDYILFIASGAFHISKVTDLIPELQGRFPIQVELLSLNEADFARILVEPDNSITKQYASLLKVENIELKFTKDAIKELANLAVLENASSENIGARRLHTLMESLLEDVSFNASGDYPPFELTIDKEYVHAHLSKNIKKHDLKRFIL